MICHVKNCNSPDDNTAFYAALNHTFKYADTTRLVAIVALTDGDDNDSNGVAELASCVNCLTLLKQAKKDVKLIIITVGELSKKARLEIGQVIAAANLLKRIFGV